MGRSCLERLRGDGIFDDALDLDNTTQDIYYDIPTSLINFSITSHSFTFWVNLNTSGEGGYGRLVILYDRKYMILGKSGGTSRFHMFLPLHSTITVDNILSHNSNTYSI